MNEAEAAICPCHCRGDPRGPHGMRNEFFKLKKKGEKLAKSGRNVTPCKKVLLIVIFAQGGHQPV